MELSRRFGRETAVDRVSFNVKAGEVLCLLGANGAGKTTTINMFLGFVRPDSGSARVLDVDAAADGVRARAHLAYIPELVALYPQLTGLQNLAYFVRLAGVRSTEEQLIGHLATAGLDADAARRPLGTYSKGMRQKVGIAIAFARSAKVLLLDEPMSGLDPRAANEFSDLLAWFAASGGGALMATHDLFRARDSGTRVGIMRKGRLVATRETKDLSHRDLEAFYLENMKSS